MTYKLTATKELLQSTIWPVLRNTGRLPDTVSVPLSQWTECCAELASLGGGYEWERSDGAVFKLYGVAVKPVMQRTEATG